MPQASGPEIGATVRISERVRFRSLAHPFARSGTAIPYVPNPCLREPRRCPSCPHWPWVSGLPCSSVSAPWPSSISLHGADWAARGPRTPRRPSRLAAIAVVAADANVGDLTAIVDVAAEADIARSVAAVLVTVLPAIAAAGAHQPGNTQPI